MGKVDNMQEQMGDVSQEKKILRKYPKKFKKSKPLLQKEEFHAKVKISQYVN